MGCLALDRSSWYLEFSVSKGRDLDLSGDGRSRTLSRWVRNFSTCRYLITCRSVDIRGSEVGLLLFPVLVVGSVGVSSHLVDKAGQLDRLVNELEHLTEIVGDGGVFGLVLFRCSLYI